jgi:hypothetical protein
VELWIHLANPDLQPVNLYTVYTCGIILFYLLTQTNQYLHQFPIFLTFARQFVF